MARLSRQQLGMLLFVTLVWGVNWPVLKLGVEGFPPLGFRALSILFSLPLVWLALRVLKLPLAFPRAHWREILWLGLFNLVLWNGLMIAAVPLLSSGRAAILGYTMPIFSALLGALFYSDRLHPRSWLGVTAAAIGVILLLWNELGSLGGRPLGVGLMLTGALAWAYGTQRLRRSQLPMSTLALSFWMMVQATIMLGAASVLLESNQWRLPTPDATWAIAYNAVLVLTLGQTAWFYLARSLPPLASTLSVMMIPVLGVFSGALWLHEVVHWQDWAAMGLMSVAIASVLWPVSSTQSRS